MYLAFWIQQLILKLWINNFQSIVDCFEQKKIAVHLIWQRILNFAFESFHNFFNQYSIALMKITSTTNKKQEDSLWLALERNYEFVVRSGEQHMY